jgi:hypothetical protein
MPGGRAVGVKDGPLLSPLIACEQITALAASKVTTARVVRVRMGSLLSGLAN